MKTKKRKKGFWIYLVILIPALTVLTALGGAKLILSGALPEKNITLIVGIGIALVALVASMLGAYRAKQKKFLWGMVYAAGYFAVLLLSNLLFFGEGYGEMPPNAIAVFAGGTVGSILGGGKRRKSA